MKKTPLIILLLFCITRLYATHNRAGEITYKCIDPKHFTYEFKIVTYTYTPSPADRPELPIDYGDGKIDTLERDSIISIVPNFIQRNVYIGVHSYSGAGTFRVSLEDPNRNAGIVNIPNSVNVVFYIETILVINPFLGCNSSPELKYPPIDNACIGQIFIHNPVAYDPDGDSLAYELIKCKEQNGLTIPGYSYPQSSSSFTLNPVTGDLIWDSPLLQGEYNVAFLIKEYRKGVFIGAVERDMQITVVACNNHPPYFDNIKDTCVVAGTNLTFKVTARDNDIPTIITLTAYGGPLIVSNPAQFPQPVNGLDSVSSTFSWDTKCENVKKNPYSVTFRAVDNGTPVNLVALKTVNIRIVAPAPTNLTATPVGNTIKLQWDPYICSNAKGFKIYRKDNGPFGWIHDCCDNGIPSLTGYVKIATVYDIDDTTFIDNNGGNGLIHGNDYCYMIYAYFADGAESCASNEACTQLKKDVPVITNVDIKTTDAANGNIYVAWSKPTQMDTIANPGPYKYLIYRSNDFLGSNLILIDSNSNGLNDTLYNDAILPLNTRDNPNSYRIALKNSYGIIGETHVASSVFLSIAPFDNRLLLSWEEHVPWTNYSYEVYRYNPSTTNFDYIATTPNKNYTDTGLTNGRIYCYKIKSIGEYSGAGFVKPIINFSQENCGSPVDVEPPCPPALSVIPNCDDVENFLIWTNPNHFCCNDVVKYYIYYSSSDNGSFELIKTITDLSDTNFIHTGLISIAGCYFVTAIDSFNNESASTNKICLDIDSCSVYELPNVFTPNGDGFNDYYRPFPYKFVEKIDLKIYNRWGNIVFQTTNPDIMWNGKDHHTKSRCNDGVYYYVCDVYEQRLAGLKKRTLHGYLHIIK